MRRWPFFLAALLWRSRPASAPPPEDEGLRPRWWVLALLAGLVTLKGLYLDPHTTFLRHYSTCRSPHGAQVHTDIWFGDILHLCGYAVSSHRVRPGDELRVTFFWEIPHHLDRPANSFVHLIGPTVNPETGTPLWGQEDKQMAINWRVPGRIYRDAAHVPGPANGAARRVSAGGRLVGIRRRRPGIPLGRILWGG